MKYRMLGRTGLKVSVLGLGGHEYARFLSPYDFPVKRRPEEPVGSEELLKTQPPRNKLIERALDAGVNYFDTGIIEEPQSLGLALKTLGRRNEVYIAAEIMGPVSRLKNVPKAKWRDTIIEGFEERLRVLQTNRIDVFNAHELADGYSRDRFEFVINVLREIKDQGKIGSIGVADHFPRFIAELIRKYDCFDSVMIPYNYHLQEAKEVLFSLCKALDIGVIAMKPFCWPYYGIPFTHFCPPSLKTGIFTPAQTSLRWILQFPEVSTVVPGTNTMAELEETLDAITKEGKIEEGTLEKCLKMALNPQGKEKLRDLVKRGEIARTRAYIRGYAEKALEGWQAY
jgi:aryl-alcohol dehydrogenase-like predicted oxidoreductase